MSEYQSCGLTSGFTSKAQMVTGIGFNTKDGGSQRPPGLRFPGADS